MRRFWAYSPHIACASVGQTRQFFMAAASAEPPPKRQKAEDALYASAPELRFPGAPVYVTAASDVPRAISALLAALHWRRPPAEGGDAAQDGYPDRDTGASAPEAALGFDIEWRATFQRGQPQRKAATLQLATAEVAYVFQLSEIGCVAGALADLLGREDVLKVGVGVDGDARKLERDHGGLAARCEELLAIGGMQHADFFCEEKGVYRVRGP